MKDEYYLTALATSLLKDWENVRFELGSGRVKEECTRKAVRIGGIIVFHLEDEKPGSSYCVMFYFW